MVDKFIFKFVCWRRKGNFVHLKCRPFQIFSFLLCSLNYVYEKVDIIC